MARPSDLDAGGLRFGTVIEDLTGLVAAVPSTVAQVAAYLRMFCVEEPHALDGLRDDTNWIWLRD